MDDGRLARARDAWSAKRAALRLEAREGYECGEYGTHEEAARAMGVSIRTMRSWLRGCDPPRYAPTNQRYSPSVRAEALSLRRDGLGVSGIARKVHASPQIVSYWIRQERKMSEKRGFAGNPTHP